MYKLAAVRVKQEKEPEKKQNESIEKESKFLFHQFVCIFLMVLQTVVQAEYMGAYFHKVTQFSSFYFLTLVSYFCLAFVFPGFLCIDFLILSFGGGVGGGVGVGGGGGGSGGGGGGGNDRRVQQPPKSYIQYVTNKIYENETFSFRNLLFGAVIFAFLNVGSSYVWNHALSISPPGISLALYQSCLVFVFILSVLFLKEKVVFIKVISVFFCVAGVLSLVLGDTHNAKSERTLKFTFGVTLPLLSALADAVFQIFYSRRLRGYNLHAVMLSTSLCGLVSIFLLPFLPLLQYIGAEQLTFVPPLDSGTTGFITATCFFTVWYYALIAACLVIMSPLYYNVGCLLAFPVASFVDVVFRGINLTTIAVFGLVFVFMGVLLMVLQDMQLLGRKGGPSAKSIVVVNFDVED